MGKRLTNIIASIGMIGTLVGSTGAAYHLINRELYQGIEITYSINDSQLGKVRKEIEHHNNHLVYFGGGAIFSLGLTATGSFKDKEEEKEES